ncbi:hypothetical protein Bca4012_033326 [Brassica carinata]|uniref:Uncharacterized protein n=1 Tax=Brassica carinata TaxID=52824 RepID=A0A8X7RD05_BRACI|nr:hypothetical protein Bca52824_045725 [Brassica carinata]
MGGHQTRTFVLAWNSRILSSNLIETASRIGKQYSYRDCIEDGHKYEARDSYLMGRFVVLLIFVFNWLKYVYGFGKS